MKLLRANIWWNAIVPQVLGWCYFFLLVFFTCNGSINAELYLKNFSLFFVSLVCTAMFGYLLNDWCDVDTDKISDKVNLLTKYNTIQKAAISFLPLIIGVIAWFSISKTSMANFFFTLQILSLFLYSVPPFRFKNRGVLGIVADAFYGHINPVLITLFVFPFYEGEAIKYFSEELLFFILLFALSLKGIRNILLHQIEDRKKDKRANIQTYVVKYGGLYTVHLLNKLLPLEIFFTGLLALTISFFVPPFFLSFLFFCVVTYLKFSGWKLAYLPTRQLKFKFLYFLNDYYECWVPVFFLLIIVARQHQLFFLLPLHLVLFPAFIYKLRNDSKIIVQNFKTEEEY